MFAALGKELERRLPGRGSAGYLEAARQLPPGLRAMAATYELDVSLTLDDLGWHFGNWHDLELAEETAWGLRELGAHELATLFDAAFSCARKYWQALGQDNWMQWYQGSELEKAVAPLNDRAWQLLDGRWNGLFSYWVEYARAHPDRLGAHPDA